MLIDHHTRDSTPRAHFLYIITSQTLRHCNSTG